jgi:hypothetical protein
MVGLPLTVDMSRPIAVAYRPIFEQDLVKGFDMLTADYHSPLDEKNASPTAENVKQEFEEFKYNFVRRARKSIDGDLFFIRIFNPLNPNKSKDYVKSLEWGDESVASSEQLAKQKRLLPLYVDAWNKSIECLRACEPPTEHDVNRDRKGEPPTEQEINRARKDEEVSMWNDMIATKTVKPTIWDRAKSFAGFRPPVASGGAHGGGKPKETVRKGPRGGKYVIKNGRKVYV